MKSMNKDMHGYVINTGAKFTYEDEDSQRFTTVVVDYLEHVVSWYDGKLQTNIYVYFTVNDSYLSRVMDMEELAWLLDSLHAKQVHSPMGYWDKIAHRIAQNPMSEWYHAPGGETSCYECGQNRYEGHRDGCEMKGYLEAVKEGVK